MPSALHGIDCEEIMTALDECHARGFLWKALGQCNDIKREVNRCLGAERFKRAQRNREQAREKRQRIEKIWDEERKREKGEIA
jgi:COX assembly mitochondrial protein 2